MPLSEPSCEIHTIDEIRYGLEIAAKIKATLACPEQVEQRHQAYFAEIERPITAFFKARWENDRSGMQVAISDALRPDIANELLEAIAGVWTA